MVKNLSTVERSTKIRFGKNCTDDQGENTIVFNASDEQIDTTTPGAVYMTPIRSGNDPNSYLMIYDENTKEIKNSGVLLASQALGIPTLEDVTGVGNTTTSNVGIANTDPKHLLSVSNTVFLGNTGTYHLQVKGQAYTDYLKVGTSVTINPLDSTNQVQVSGQIKSTTLLTDKIALNNTNPLAYKFSLGDKLFMTDAGTTSLLTTKNISADTYIGDGGSLTGLSFDDITGRNATTSASIDLANTGTSLTTAGNVVVGNTLSANTLKVNDLSVGYVPVVTDGNVLTDSTIQIPSVGTLRMDADVSIYGNLVTYGNVTQISANNLTVDDPLILLGNHNPLDTNDLGVIMRRPTANVAMGFRGDEEEFMIGYTHSYASGTSLVPLTTKDVDVKVYGNLTANALSGVNLYGNIKGSNTISASTVSALTLNANVVASNMYGVIAGANTISASTVSALTLNANVVASNMYGVIAGANTISASTVSALTLNANVVADNVVASNMYGVIAGANTISASTVSALTLNANVVADNVVASNMYGVIAGANTISASVITASNVNTQNVVANVITANLYYGDGGLLSNIASTLQDATVNGNTTNLVVQFTNPTTAFTTVSTANVGVNVSQLNDVTVTTPLDNQILSYVDGTGWMNDYLDHTVIRVKNTNVSSMSKGDVVCAVGPNDGNDNMSVHLANAAVPARMPALGILTQALTVGLSGTAVSYGRADGVNTSGFLEGETLYVSNTVNGGISNVKPYGPTDGIQNIGVCVKSATNGIIFVTGIGRTNDIPNAPLSSSPNYVYVNESGNDLKKIAPSDLLTKLQTLEQVVNTGNTVANTIQLTGLTTTGNVSVGSNIVVSGLKDTVNKYLPMVNNDGTLIKSPVYVDHTGKYVITAGEAEFLGNITLGGNTTILSSTSVVIEDRIFGIGSNNASSGLDTGVMFEHKDGETYANIAIIYHPQDHTLVLGYTQNTFADDHILSFYDADHVMLVDIEGNLLVQNNLSVANGSYFGDGTTLTGVALSADLTSNAARIDTLVTDLGDNSSRITTVSDDLVSNAARIDTLVTDLGDNSSRITTVSDDLVSNAARIDTLITDLGDNSSRITTVSDDLVSNAARIDTLITDLGDNSSRITTVSDDLVSNAARIDTLVTDLGDNSSRITTVSDDLVSNAARIDTLITDLGDNSSRITTVSDDLVSNAARIDTLITDLGDNSSRIDLKAPLLDPVFTNNVTVSGNLTVLGTTTTIDTENLTVKDPIIALSNVGAAVDSGIMLNRPAAGDNVFTGFDHSLSEYTMGYTDSSALDTSITIKDGTNFVANVHGNVHALYFIGDGSQLTGVGTGGGGGASTLQEVTDLGNVTSNTILFTNTDTSLVASGNIEAKNIQLTDPGITASVAGTVLTIDAANKTYGTGPIVSLGNNLDTLIYSNLISGAQVIIPMLASGNTRYVSNALSNVNWFAYQSSVEIAQGAHGLLTLSNLYGNVYVNALGLYPPGGGS